MSRRKRILIAIVVVELLLAGGWLWLHGLAMTSQAARDSARVIGEVFGGAMGLVLALSPLLYLMARGNDRAAAASSTARSAKAK